MVTEILKNYIPEHAEPLSEEQYAQLERYAELLVEWNEKMNLTAITDPEGIAVKHFLDCLAYLKRVKMGSLELDESLEEGKMRLMTDEEIKKLINNE